VTEPAAVVSRSGHYMAALERSGKVKPVPQIFALFFISKLDYPSLISLFAIKYFARIF
jgi:hypothetical protein